MTSMPYDSIWNGRSGARNRPAAVKMAMVEKKPGCICGQWEKIRTMLFQVLRNYPDARDAVVVGLRQLLAAEQPNAG